ncbi:MAG TPA: sugar phosphate isomerase/epimerase [Gemmataceae bacterium]|jgi:sugar phosphate isomerase/epimerase|nr:sugar phosphate isomerase/epimerase [Gemmataceae bacterium]
MFDGLLSRRDAIRTGLAAAAAAAVPGLGRAKDDAFGGFKLACQSYTFRNFSFEQAVKKIAAAGIPYAEFFRNHIPTNAKPDAIKAALTVCKDNGVTPIAFGVESFDKNHDANKAKFDFAAALGVKALSADPTPDSFDSLDKLCAEYKIAIAIHPHGPAGKGRHRWWSAETILAAVKDHHELIGTCLDTGHLIRMAQLGEMLDPAQQIRVMGKRNFGMHLKDHDNKRKTDVLYGKDGGVLDVPAVLKALREVKFDGYVAIEYEAKPEEPTEDVKALVKIFQESVAKIG